MMFCTRHNLLSRYLAGLIAFLISYAAVFKCVHLLGDVQAETVRVSLFHAQNPASKLSSHSSADAVATAALPPGAPCAVCAELAKMAVPAALSSQSGITLSTSVLSPLPALTPRPALSSTVRFFSSRAPPSA